MQGRTVQRGESLQRQGDSSADPDDPGVKQVVDAIGDDNIVTATDFAHLAGRGYVDALESTINLENVSEATKRKMMWDNAARLYAIAE